MKKLLLCLLVLMPLCFFAQKKEINFSKDFEVTKGDPYKVADSYNKRYWTKGNRMINLIRDKDDLIFRLFNTDNLKLISEKEIKDFENGFVIEDFIDFGGKIYLFYEGYGIEAI